MDVELHDGGLPMAYPDPAAANEAPRPYSSHVTYTNGNDDFLEDRSNTTSPSQTTEDISSGGSTPHNTSIVSPLPPTEGDRSISLNEYFRSGTIELDDGSNNESPHPDESVSANAGSKRGGRRGRPAKTRGRGKWKSLIKGTEHADLFKKPRLRRQAGGLDLKTPGAKPGNAHLTHIDPGLEFKTLQGRAMAAWMRQDYVVAEQLALEAVRVNPEVYDAHSLLSDALFAQGRTFEALMAKHIGAATARDPNIYTEVAEQWLELYARDGDRRCLSWALDDFRQALKGLQSDCRARRGMRDAYELFGDQKGSKFMSKSIIRYDPGDLENVVKYAQYCASDSELSIARAAFENAFRLNERKDVIADPDTQWTYLNVYIDILDRAQAYAEAVLQLKRKARWLLGRHNEDFWDRFQEDDREFDLENNRRNYVLEFQQGRASHDASKYGMGLPLDLRVKLGFLRLKMGSSYNVEAQRHLIHLLRLRNEMAEFHDLFVLSADTLVDRGMTDAAIDFYSAIREHPRFMSEKIYMSLAQCYRTAKEPYKAIECYQTIIDQDPSNVTARVQLANTYERMGLRDKAQDIADEVIRLGHEETLRREKTFLLKRRRRRKSHGHTTDSGKNQNGKTPADASEPNLVHSDTTMQDDHDVICSSDRGQEDATQSPTRVRPPRMPMKEWERLQSQHKFIHEHYAIVKRLWFVTERNLEDEDDERNRDDEETILEVEEWANHASAMLFEFRSVRAFFPKRQRGRNFRGFRGIVHADAMDEMAALKDRLQKGTTSASTPAVRGSHQFQDIPMVVWHRIAVELALVYARSCDIDNCFDIVDEVLMHCTAFRYSSELTNVSCAIAIYCAVLFGDNRTLAETARTYIVSSSFRSSDAYQFLAGVMRIGSGSVSGYQDGNLSKFMLRSVKMHDYAAMSDEMREVWKNGSEAQKKIAKRLSRLGDTRDELDPDVLAIHAHICMTNKTNKFGPGGALHPMGYLFRALAIRPDSEVLNLSIGTIFLRASTYRTTSSRQSDIAQGLAFFRRYYRLKVADGKAGHLQEAEFNMARFWYQIGLTHLAVSGFEKVLDLSPKVHAEGPEIRDGQAYDCEDLSPEAAFALQTIFKTMGNVEAARGVTEKWLVVR